MSQRLPRISLDQMDGDLASALEPRVKRLGYLGEFFQCLAHQPKALLAFQAFTDAAKAELPAKLTETIALTAAAVMGNGYESHQHERLSIRLGYGREWVGQILTFGIPASTEMTAEEQIVQRFVVQALRTNGREAGPLFEQVVDALGPAAAVSVLMILCRYVAHGLVVNTLGLAPPVPSIFEDGFAG